MFEKWRAKKARIREIREKYLSPKYYRVFELTYNVLTGTIDSYVTYKFFPKRLEVHELFALGTAIQGTKDDGSSVVEMTSSIERFYVSRVEMPGSCLTIRYVAAEVDHTAFEKFLPQAMEELKHVEKMAIERCNYSLKAAEDIRRKAKAHYFGKVDASHHTEAGQVSVISSNRREQGKQPKVPEIEVLMG
jgi:hypothetical protein